jgi:hypothetical protein
MTKRLPPPGGNGKLPSRRPPPGHPALEKDWFVRFDELSGVYDTLVEDYNRLKSCSGSNMVRALMHSLVPCDDEEVFDRLEWLWPAVKNIHVPERNYYATRASVLTGSFPSAAPHNPEVFIKMLISHILVKAPSCMVLEAACFELADKHKYSNMPTIADLMALIEKHEKLWEERLRIHNDIESGRVREFAERRLAYELEQEQKKIEWTIGRLEKLNEKCIERCNEPDANVEEMIAELREGGIDVLNEDFEKVLCDLEHEAWKIIDVVRRLTELEQHDDLIAKVKEGGFAMAEEIEPKLREWEKEQREWERECEKYYSDTKPSARRGGARIHF